MPGVGWTGFLAWLAIGVAMLIFVDSTVFRLVAGLLILWDVIGFARHRLRASAKTAAGDG